MTAASGTSVHCSMNGGYGLYRLQSNTSLHSASLSARNNFDLKNSEAATMVLADDLFSLRCMLLLCQAVKVQRAATISNCTHSCLNQVVGF